MLRCLWLPRLQQLVIFCHFTSSVALLTNCDLICVYIAKHKPDQSARALSPWGKRFCLRFSVLLRMGLEGIIGDTQRPVRLVLIAVALGVVASTVAGALCAQRQHLVSIGAAIGNGSAATTTTTTTLLPGSVTDSVCK